MRIPFGGWVLVADARKALVLRNGGNVLDLKLQVQQVLDAPPNPATRDQGADKPGRAVSVGRPSAFEQTDWHALAEVQFAERIVQMLEKVSHEEAVDALVLVAPPRMLASLRKGLSDQLKRAIIAELDKDFTKHPVGEIQRYLTLA
jgi:protein required for attachment to host cells